MLLPKWYWGNREPVNCCGSIHPRTPFDVVLEDEGSCLAVTALGAQVLSHKPYQQGHLGMVTVAVLLCCCVPSRTRGEAASECSVRAAVRS